MEYKTVIFDESDSQFHKKRQDGESLHDYAFRIHGRENIFRSDYVLFLNSKLKTINIIKTRSDEAETRAILNKIVEKYQYYVDIINYTTVSQKFVSFRDFVDNEFDEIMYVKKFREFVESHER